MNGAPKWTLTGDKIPDFFLDFRDFCEIQGLFPTVKSVNRIPGLFPLAWEPWEGQVVFYEEPFTNKTDRYKINIVESGII